MELTFPMSQIQPTAHYVDLEAWERTYFIECISHLLERKRGNLEEEEGDKRRR